MSERLTAREERRIRGYLSLHHEPYANRPTIQTLLGEVDALRQELDEERQEARRWRDAVRQEMRGELSPLDALLMEEVERLTRELNQARARAAAWKHAAKVWRDREMWYSNPRRVRQPVRRREQR